MKNSLLLLAISIVLTSCISYSVGTTARPVPQDEFRQNMSVYFIPNGIEDVNSEGEVDASLAYASSDWEGRWGLSDRSDLGLRVPAASGAILTYKRMLNQVNDPERAAVSTIVGTGIVNFGNHAFFEGGLIASGREDDHVPYGGIRAMHVLPLNTTAVNDKPTIGAFGGVRMRVNSRFSLSPELGVYYDESALEIRKRNIIFIPSLTFHWD